MNKKIFCLILTFILVIINLSGCISYPFGTPAEPTKHPKQPLISIDDNGNTYLFWTFYDNGEYILKFKVINDEGRTLKEKEIFKKSFIRSPKLLFDAKDKFHFFYIGGGKFYEYLEIDKNGDILNTKVINETYKYNKKQVWDYFDVTMDVDNNIFLIWLTEDNTICCIKMDTNGIIKEIEELGYFIEDIKNLRRSGDSSAIHIRVDNSSIIWAVWNLGLNSYNTITNRVYGVNKTLSGDFIEIDSLNKIYIKSGNVVKLINDNRSIITNISILNQTVISDYPVIENEKGDYLYLGERGCVDNNNNVHIVELHEELKEWESGRYYESYYYNTIYYKKFDKNGTVLIDNMVIDTDGEPIWETGSYQLTSFIILLIFILPVAILIIILLYLSFRKKKNNNIWRK